MKIGYRELSSMPPWSKRLRQLVEDYPDSAIGISRSMGKSHSYINNLLTGRLTPSLAALEDIAQFFDVPMASFFTEAGGVGTIPLITENLPKADVQKIKARLTGTRNDNLADYPLIYSPWTLSNQAIALRVEGSIMASGDQGYAQDTIVFFEPASADECHQQPTLFHKSGRLLFRQFDTGFMRPLNPQFPAEAISAWQPLAVAVASMKLFPLPDNYLPD